MIVLKSLEHESLSTIHRAFIDAFSEYEVKIDMPIEKLNEMMITRSYSKDLSIGCYDNDRLVGFTLVGYRETGKNKECYDIATGIIKSHQKMGIGDKVLKELMTRLKKTSVNSFCLEVLENNKAAQKIYSNNGFVITRKLCCYKKENENMNYAQEEIIEEEIPDISDECLYCSFPPSWQNSLVSYRNSREKYHIALVYDKDKSVLGYGIIHKGTGSILQIGSKPSVNRESTIIEILNKLYVEIPKEKYTYLNVEEGSWIGSVLKKCGFENNINQYEMKYCITN